MNRTFLDTYCSDVVPCVIMEETSHSVWVNSKAYEWAGIPEDVKDDVSRGMIYMRTNGATGDLNGIVLENAGIAMLENAFDPEVTK